MAPLVVTDGLTGLRSPSVLPGHHPPETTVALGPRRWGDAVQRDWTFALRSISLKQQWGCRLVSLIVFQALAGSVQRSAWR
jgi:hypothetical protein